LVTGCNDTRNLAPPAPDKPWPVPASAAPTSAEIPPVSAATPDQISPGRRYSLAELIDIAERRNQATRIAWEQARQAAINVGIAQAAFLPALAASVIGGYQHVALPFPSNLVPRGFITASIEEILPTLAINYLLLDFGGRQAAANATRQLSVAANVTFNRAHQKLIFDVARAYFSLSGANAALTAAEQALKDGQQLQNSVEALQSRGLATVVTVQLARSDTAQRRYDVAQVRTAQHDAAYGLLTAMDLPPTTHLQIEDTSARPLPQQADGTLQRLLGEALRRRPDLIAAVAQLRATDEGIALARSAFLPKLSVSGNIQGNIGQIAVDNLPNQGVKQPQWGVFLHFDWPLYQGGLLQNQMRAAESRRAAAADAVQEARVQTLREVALAYDQLDTGLQQYDAARALLNAATTAFSAARDSYTQGVGTFTDAATAEAGLAVARATVARAHTQSLVSAAGLAFATGALNADTAAALTVVGK
jgi:outer membrane protein